MSCFNPCFNGTTSATFLCKSFSVNIWVVSILVLMELPLQPILVDEELEIEEGVSILVLMELPLQQLT